MVTVHKAAVVPVSVKENAAVLFVTAPSVTPVISVVHVALPCTVMAVEALLASNPEPLRTAL